MRLFAAAASAWLLVACVTGPGRPDGGADAAVEPGDAGPVVVDAGFDAGDLTPQPADVVTSGSRLHLRGATSPDGLRQVLAVFDSTSLNDCEFLPAADGELRCLPVNVPVLTVGWFSDAACTQALQRRVGPACQSASVAQTVDSSVCPARRTLFPLSQESHPAMVFTRDSLGACTGAAPATGEHFFPVGAEQPASSFVRGVVTTSSGSGVVTRRLHGDDGLDIPWGLVDSASTSECAPQLVGAEVRCLPPLAPQQGYADSVCSMPAFSDAVGTCPSLTMGLVSGAPECGGSLVQLGAVVSAAFAKNGVNCSAVGGVSSLRAGGSTVAASTFPLAIESRAGYRVQQRRFTWPGGVTKSVGWFDTQLQEFCDPTALTTDDTHRCAPSTPGFVVSGYFSDQGCSKPLISTRDVQCGTPKFATQVLATCPAHVRVFRAGAAFTGAAWEGTASDCHIALTSGAAALYRVGAEVMPAELAAFHDQMF